MLNNRAVSAYFTIKHILYYIFAGQDTAMPRQTAVTAYLKSKQLLLFDFVFEFNDISLHNIAYIEAWMGDVLP